MRKIYKKHWKKFLLLGLIKKAIILFFLFHSSLYASGTYSDVNFTDYEENATVYLANYYSYQDFKNLDISSRTSKNLLSARDDALFETVSDIDDVNGIGTDQLYYLRQASHLIDWGNYTNQLGLTLHQTNFLYGLTAILIGFTMLIFFTLVVIL